jgi:hypothetical protein
MEIKRLNRRGEAGAVYKLTKPLYPGMKRRAFHPLTHYHAFVVQNELPEGWVGYLLTGVTVEPWPLHVAVAATHFELSRLLARKPTHFLRVPLWHLDRLSAEKIGQVTAAGEAYLAQHALQGPAPLTWREYCEQYEPRETA